MGQHIILHHICQRATVHATTQYTLAQLIFGRNSIISQHHDIGWANKNKTLSMKAMNVKIVIKPTTHTNMETRSYLKVYRKQNSISTPT